MDLHPQFCDVSEHIHSIKPQRIALKFEEKKRENRFLREIIQARSRSIIFREIFLCCFQFQISLHNFC